MTLAKVLIVDDQQDHADLIVHALSNHNPAWQIDVCNSCDQASQWLNSQIPLIMISDLKLPDGDGLSLLRNDSQPGYPTIFVTAHGNEQTAVKIIKAGAQDYLVKGDATFKTIGRTVDRCLREWQNVIDLAAAERGQRQLQQQLQQAQKMESIGHLTGGIAHDFNNILASMLGFTELAAHQLANGDLTKIESYLSNVRSAGEKARDLIKQMLAFSRGGTRNPESLHLAPLIEETLHLLKPNLDSRITINTDIAANLPSVYHDRIQIQQLLMNLLINASDAIGQCNGEVALSLQQESFHDRNCSSCMQPVSGEYTVLTVADSGPGIDDETLRRIFEPFFTTKEGSRGSGMGLSVVHGIAHEAGGHLFADHDPRLHGAQFKLVFPPYQSDAPQTDNAFDPAEKMIWIVDDNEQFSQYLSEILQLDGYQTETFNEPQFALQSLKLANSSSLEPDLLITDLKMDHLDGQALIQAVRLINPLLPIVLCSGYPGSLDQLDIDALNLAGVLDKPLNSLKLLELLGKVLSGQVETIDC